MRLVEPGIWRNSVREYKIYRHELMLELLDPRFFSHFSNEFLLPQYSLARYQWGVASIKPKILIKIMDYKLRLNEDDRTRKHRSFELYPLGMQRSEYSETSSQSYEIEYSDVLHFDISYIYTSGMRRIDRYGYISPSEVQPFLLI